MRKKDVCWGETTPTFDETWGQKAEKKKVGDLGRHHFKVSTFYTAIN